MAQSEDGTTPLLLAALNGTTENIQVLLNAGADVTVQNGFGFTPLHIAADRGSTANVKALLDAGADVQAQ
jgi:ankyrin repeat protein